MKVRAALLQFAYPLIKLAAPVTVLICGGAVFTGFWSHSLRWLICGFLTPYLFPLSLYRLLEWLSPQREGATRIRRGQYHPWVAAFRVQIFYAVFPVFEDALKIFPGSYSFWLRLWGSSIGKRVFISPGCEVFDRGMLVISDDVTIGYGVTFSAHLMRDRGIRRLLYLKKIRIGAGAFVGAQCILGPGSVLSEGAALPAGANMTVNCLDEFFSPVLEKKRQQALSL